MKDETIQIPASITFRDPLESLIIPDDWSPSPALKERIKKRLKQIDARIATVTGNRFPVFYSD